MSHRFYTEDGCWWLSQWWESESGDYESKLCESSLDNVYKDFPDNLITYAQKLGKGCQKDFAEAIAKLARKSVESLFPGILVNKALLKHVLGDKQNGSNSHNVALADKVAFQSQDLLAF